ncbi:A-kinase anchor protein 8-like [Columba livia]|nr:A-kinase anchor protein 8-like [Columba livia]
MGKMNQRLDMVPHMDADAVPGGHYDRYDSYDPYDSRSPMNDRNMYPLRLRLRLHRIGTRQRQRPTRGPTDNFYGNRREQYHNRYNRDNFAQRGQNWGRTRKKMRKDPTAKKRKQTNSSDEPDSKAAKTDCSDNSDSDNDEGTEGESGEREDREGSRGEGEDEEGRDSEKGALTIQEEISQIKRKLQAGRKTQDRQKKRHRDPHGGEVGAPHCLGLLGLLPLDLNLLSPPCFGSSSCARCASTEPFYDDEMNSHLESKFHKEHFKFVGTKLPPTNGRFPPALQKAEQTRVKASEPLLGVTGKRSVVQEYVANKTRKTEERRQAIDDINAVIQQIYRDQDLTQDVGMEHFIKKVEAAHCAACDLFIPMQFGLIQKHLKSLDHNHNRRAMMEQSKRSSLVVARSILNNKLISKKLERYLKVGVQPELNFEGENPFTDDPEEKEEHEEGEGGTSGNVEEGTAEGGDENKDEEENPEEENPEEENPEEENPEEENPEEENPKEENPEEENPGDETKDPDKSEDTDPEKSEAEGAENEGEREEPETETQTEAPTQPGEDAEQPDSAPAEEEDEEEGEEAAAAPDAE